MPLRSLNLLEREVKNLLMLLEAQIPANVAAPVNQKHVNRLNRELTRYFLDLGEAFPYEQVDQVYYTYVKEAESDSDTGNLIDPVLLALTPALVDILRSNGVTSYVAGSVQTLAYGRTKLGIPIIGEGPPIDEAIEYAERRSSMLVRNINDETRRQIQGVVARSIREKWGIDKLKRELKSKFKEMADIRAKRIARTETNDSLSQAFMDRSQEMGVEYKEWVVTHPCPICEENEAEGVVPLNHVFASGHERPPAHVNCRCALAPARIQEEIQ